jgi:hypothetical protein
VKDASPTGKAKDDARPEDTKKTPAEWAVECGHVDPPVPEGGRCNASLMKAWVFKAACVHHGWGSKHPIDLPLTRAEYEAAIDALLKLSVGEHHRDPKAEKKAPPGVPA